MIATLDTLIARRVIDKDGCWLWTGATMPAGHGQIRINNELYLVHRLAAHIYWNFDLRSSLKVLHKCDKGACFREECLYIGTQKNNVQDMYDRNRHDRPSTLSATHCKRGHEYTTANTRYYRGRNICRACRNMLERKYRSLKA